MCALVRHGVEEDKIGFLVVVQEPICVRDVREAVPNRGQGVLRNAKGHLEVRAGAAENLESRGLLYTYKGLKEIEGSLERDERKKVLLVDLVPSPNAI